MSDEEKIKKIFQQVCTDNGVDFDKTTFISKEVAFTLCSHTAIQYKEYLKNSLDKRILEFRKSVFEAGKLKYTTQMLENFIRYWSEPDRAAKPKMKFEKEKTWLLSSRLQKWAEFNYDKIVCYLTDSEKTIKEKQHALAVSMEPFLKQYGRDMLNQFFKFWSQPENKTNPTFLRWEQEKFWQLEQRLSQWAQRNQKQTA